jgi:hypothetical protein
LAINEKKNANQNADFGIYQIASIMLVIGVRTEATFAVSFRLPVASAMVPNMSAK